MSVTDPQNIQTFLNYTKLHVITAQRAMFRPRSEILEISSQRLRQNFTRSDTPRCQRGNCEHCASLFDGISVSEVQSKSVEKITRAE